MLAIIPARGGSKGLPGKNIKILLDKPLIAYTIEAALKVAEIDRVFVSTDDEDIARVAKQYGAECNYLRPAHLATDSARAIDVYNFILEKFEKEGQKYDEVIILQPTSPLRTSRNIKDAIDLFYANHADSVISYCEEHHPIIWHKYLDAKGRFEDIFESGLKNRQDERKSYYPNGAIYIFKSELLKSGKYYSSQSFAYVMEREFSVDIDTITDFKQAEFFLKGNA